jgi:4-hydroxybenzoate polyprenyltransferase
LFRRSGALLGTTAISFIWIASQALGVSVRVHQLAIIGGVAFASYALDRTVDMISKKSPRRAEVLGWMMAFGIGIVSVVASRSADAGGSWGFVAIYPLAVALYQRVKRIPFAKAFYVGVLWSSLVAFPAAACVRARLTLVTALALFIFGKILVGTIACDLKDRETDGAAGLKTFPTVFGRKRTIALLQVLNVSFACTTLGLIVIGVLPSFMWALECHAVGVAWLLARMFTRDGWRSLLLSEVMLDAGYALLLPLAALGARLS